MAKDAGKNEDNNQLGAIRDIIFGRQMQEYEERFARLENQLQERLQQLQNKVGDELGQLRDGQEKSTQSLDENLSAVEQKLDGQLNQLQEELLQNRNEMITSVSDQIDSLRRECISRQSLAAILRDAADQIDPQ